MALGILTVAAIIAIGSVRTITAVTAVFTVGAITIVITILTLRHVDTVEHDAGIGQLALLREVVEQCEAGLRCVVGTANEHADIGMGGNLQGVGDKSDGGRIKDNVIVILLQQFDNLAEGVACQELGGMYYYVMMVWLHLTLWVLLSILVIAIMRI